MTTWGIVLGVIIAGHSVAAAVAWAFINVPESSVLMLLLSAALVALLILVVGWTEAALVLSARGGSRWRDTAIGAWRRWTAVVPAAALFGGCWWIAGTAEAWLASHAGEIDAWIMLQSGWTDTAWLHRLIGVAFFFVRWVLGLSVALAALSAAVLDGASALLDTRWLRAGVSRSLLGAVGLVFVLLIVLPLRAVYWRPETLGAGGIEPWFVALKLGVILLVTHVGWTIAVVRAARTVSAGSTGR